MSKINKELEDGVVLEYLNKISMFNVGIKFSISEPTVKKILVKHNVVLRSRSEAKRIYKTNEEYFMKIDTERKSYFLGIIVSDGSITDNKLRLGLIDKSIVEEVNKDISPERPLTHKKLYTGNIYTMLQVKSFKMIEDLYKIGVYKDKTFYCSFNKIIKSIPNELIHHFIRGVFDGDGCISQGRNKVKSGIYTYPKVEITDSNIFIQELHNYLISISKLNLPNNKLLALKKSKTHCSIQYSGRENGKRIYDYLYTDCTICIKRKHEKFLGYNYA